MWHQLATEKYRDSHNCLTITRRPWTEQGYRIICAYATAGHTSPNVLIHEGMAWEHFPHYWLLLGHISQGFSLRLPCIDVYMYVYVSCMIPMYFMAMYVLVIICILYDP